MKKTLAIILAILMIVGAVPMAFAAETAQISGVSFSGDVVTYDEASNTYIIAIPKDTQEYVLYDIIISGTNLESVATGEGIDSGYKIGFDWSANDGMPNAYNDISFYTYDGETDTARGEFGNYIEDIGMTDGVYFCNGIADDGTKNWELACYIKVVYAPEVNEDITASDGENCPDCGRPVHEGELNEYLCLLITFIKLVASAIRALEV